MFEFDHTNSSSSIHIPVQFGKNMEEAFSHILIGEQRMS